MKGKKINNEFVISFIAQCIQSGYNTPKEITNKAQIEIDEISKKIQEIENLKKIRSNLLDVISCFENKNKNYYIDNLNLYKIKNHHICQYIVSLLKDHSILMSDLQTNQFTEHDLIFCVKQLLEYHVISKIGITLLKGEKFQEYIDLLTRN